MTARIHLVLDERDAGAFRAQAASEGLSLSEWLRVAARERLERQRPSEITTVADLDRFFAECAAQEGETQEPHWEQHLEVMRRSRSIGLDAG